MTVANQIIINAKADEEKTVKSFLNGLVAKALLEKGCQKFELYQGDEDRSYFVIIEIWKSEKRYAMYKESAMYQELQAHKSISKQTTLGLRLPQCLTKLGLKKN